MNRSIVAALALALTTAFAVPAMAHETSSTVYPVPAAQFQQKVEARLAKSRARMEAVVAKGKLTPEQAATWRTKADARATRVESEMKKAVADGVVTKDEAKAVRAVAGRGHHGHRGQGGERGARAQKKA